MTREELAKWLCRHVQRRRLERVGERVPDESADAFSGLPPLERQNWLDMADAVLVFNHAQHPVERLGELASDWLRYTTQLEHDASWRDEMRRAIVIEMRAEVNQLAKECGLDA